MIISNGADIKNFVHMCVVVDVPNGAITDRTEYEAENFNTIDDSRVFHKSPTDEEIEAAEKNGATPSLPIDHDRYVSFHTAPNHDKTIYYPNLFRFDEQKILEKHKDKIEANLKNDTGKERIKKYGS